MSFSLKGPSETCLTLTVNQWESLIKLLNSLETAKLSEANIASINLLEFQLEVNIREGNLVRIQKI